MGKNRINIYNNYLKKNILSDEISDQSTYKTQTGEIVPTDGHSKEWMNDFEWRISDWINGYTESPDEELDEEQIDYIKKNMENSINNSKVRSLNTPDNEMI